MRLPWADTQVRPYNNNSTCPPAPLEKGGLVFKLAPMVVVDGSLLPNSAGPTDRTDHVERSRGQDDIILFCLIHEYFESCRNIRD